MQTRFLVKTVLVFIVSGFIMAGAFGQNITLKGKVTDKGDKTPVIGATVALVSQKDSAQLSLKVTDSKGNFQFSNLDPATYIVKVSFSGYEKVEQKIALQDRKSVV